uniref:Cadherin domain-containing protein n=1 Tax=Ciona intestinalis TaxID=7719 RepID=F6Q874_CIOIN
VVITIDDVQDNEPRFVHLPYNRRINEDIAKGTSVVTISAIDGDRGQPNDVAYSIVSGNEDGKFSLDSSGDVRVASRIDRDVIGFSGSYVLTIRATEIPTRGSSGGAFREVSFDVIVDDVNDERPRFERRSYRMNVPETTPVGTALPMLIRVEGMIFDVTDKDQDANSDVTMSVEWNMSDHIALSPVTFRHRGDVTIVLKQPLDFETQRRVQFRIFANETNNPALFTECDVTIDVENENDNAPLFANTEYHVNVSENTEVGELIFRASATDHDSGKFGRIYYSLEDAHGDVTIGTVFRLNELTGDITTKPGISPDYETIPVYDVTIMAQDNGIPSLSTTRKLRIEIDDVNDNAPLFTKSIYDVTVDENDRLRDFGVEATDVDSGKDGTIRYRISGGNDRGVFRINDVTGDITNVKVLDYERLGDHVMLDVIAQDNGNDVQLSSSAKVVITINDVNDNAPIFSRSTETSFQVQENILGPKIAKFTAYDVDSGDNGRVTYSIVTGNDDNTFTISPLDGELRVTHGVELDREHEAYYNVTICAMDRGEIPKYFFLFSFFFCFNYFYRKKNFNFLFQIFTQIHVTDANDNPPQFVQFPNRINLSENTVMGFSVYHLVAEDMDSGTELRFVSQPIVAIDNDDGRNADVTYSLVNDESGFFAIDSLTGSLRTIVNIVAPGQSLDREVMSQYRLVVMATDRASNPLSSTAVATVTIDDVNDSRPRFLSPFLRIQVHENSPVGSKVTTLVATDDDLNSDLVFSMTSTDNDIIISWFHLNSSSASLVTKSRLDREVLSPPGGPGWVNITLTASDHGFPSPRSTRVIVRVRVDDVNDNYPVFTEDNYDIEIPEDLQPGSIVTSAIAMDIDDSAYGDVTYKLHGAVGFFTIHQILGKIRLVKPLDREVISEHKLTIVATDNVRGSRNNRKKTTKKMTITVSDVNDNSPVFDQPQQYKISVLENTTPGTRVAMVTATDRDEGNNGHVTYSLRAFNRNTYFFSIDPIDGDVTISRQVVASPRLPLVGDVVVFATDGGGRESNMTLQVRIVDVNDHVPKFESPAFNVIRILEEQPGGLFVTQAMATDDDIGLNADVRYRLHDPDLTNQGAFMIDDVTGRVITSRRLDRELRHSYSVVIQAHDLGDPQLQSTRILNVILDDVNDNRPNFPASGSQANKPHYYVGASQRLRFPEDAPIGSIVGHVTRAVDRDDSAQIFYHILTQDVSGEPILGMNGDKIVLMREVDREAVERNIVLLVKPFLTLNSRYQIPTRMKPNQNTGLLVLNNRHTSLIGATDNPNFTRPFLLGRWDATVQQQPSALMADDVIANDVTRPIHLMWDPARDASLLRLYVTVDDVIDEPPRFSRDVYVTAVEGNTRPRTKIIQINATDYDVNDDVTYSIQNINFHRPDNSTSYRRNAFVINPRNGVIKSGSHVIKGKGYFLMTVQARDSANHSATCQVKVHILQRSKKIQFVLESPPDVVREQQEKFSETLRRMTGSIVTIDDVSPHLTTKRERDVTRSDVTIRIFDPQAN